MSLASNIFFKDAQPLDTVARIKNILKENDIQTVEEWYDSHVPNCYSIRVTVAGTIFGSNGKGTNKDYALASAYGELAERLQLGHVWRSKLSVENGASSSELQSVLVSADSITEKKPRWCDVYAREVLRSTGEEIAPEAIVRQFADQDGNVRATPFYCVTTDTIEHIPTSLVNTVYVTSGGAAGNTMEEAMVQALSEIVERHHKLRILSEGTITPQIPEEFLRSSAIGYDIIEYLRSKDFRVIVKDCSLGTKFPVICVCLIDTKTGRYHTHFGAHPSFDIALQRTLTETFQGRKLETVASHDNFCRKGNQAMDLAHQMTELVYGTSEKQPTFFLDADCSYDRIPDLTGTDNKEMLRNCIAFFQEQGYDILVRDSSCLGFPTYQIIIPGYSEAFPNRLSLKHNDIRYSSYVAGVLRNPAAASVDALMGFMMHMAQSKRHSGANMNTFIQETGIPALISLDEDFYFKNAAIGHVSYTLGKKQDALSCMNAMFRSAPKEDMEYLLCVKRYLTMLIDGYEADTIKLVLTKFHKPETVDTLYTIVAKKQNLFDPIVLKCDRKCHSSCRLYDKCQKNHIDGLIAAIGQKAKAMDQAPMIERLRNL